jgi:aminobenzoyl-glutamate utilization protein B
MWFDSAPEMKHTQLTTVNSLQMTRMDHSAIAKRHWLPLQPEIVSKFNELWATPELGNMEFMAQAALCAWLENYGFEVERAVGGLPTAFKARRGKGGPKVALLAEYDALPGTDNDAVTERRRRGHPAGHACGHNLIGPANCGAAIAAALAAEEAGLAGEIVVFGTPAEEIVWGKVAMLGLGVFDGVDIILTSHGDYQNGAISRPCQSVLNGEVVFLGESGHGGGTRRRNALDAAELAVQSLERLRAHHFPDTSVEHVLRVAGHIPNVTPDEARLWLTARHENFERAREVFDFAIGVAARSAEMTGVAFRHQFIAGTRGYLANDTLAETLHAALATVGPPRWTEEGRDFMRALARTCRPDGGFRLDEEVGLYREGLDPYGQDDGEVSWRIPLGRVNWAFPDQVPLHNWALTALAGHEASHPGPLMASEALAAATLRLLADPAIIQAAKAELGDRTKGITLGQPMFGALETMRHRPDAFWNASWVE